MSYITIKDNYMWGHVERNSHQQRRRRRSVDNKQEGVQGVVVVEQKEKGKELEQQRKSSVSHFTQGLLCDDQEEHDDWANTINCFVD